MSERLAGKGAKNVKSLCYNGFDLVRQLLFHKPVKRHFAILCLFGLVIAPLQCATLERLSLSEMIAKATGIVRAQVVRESIARTGPVIYTHYQLQVSERYKGAAQSTVDLALPGGVADGVQQAFSGVPQLHPGEEYVFFLWTGKSGLTQVIGLSQGLFAVSDVKAKDPALKRAASHEMVLDRATGRQVQDQTLTMNLSALRAQISNTLAVQGIK